MKKYNLYLLIFLFLLITTAGVAQNALIDENFYVIEDFSGMLKSHISEHLIPKGSAQQAINVRPNETFGVLTKRPKMFLFSTAPTAAVKTLFRHYVSDDTKHLIATYSSKVSAFDSSGTETVLFASGSDSKRWSFVTYKDKLIGTNGTDRPKKWDNSTSDTANTDGARTENDLMADLGAPFAELDTGTDLDASSWYQYKVAFYDGSTYKYSDARSNPILTGSSVYNIALTDVPLGPSGTTHRYIYRTVGNSSRANVVADTTFYLVGTIADNSTTTFADSTTDNDADDDAAPTWTTASGGTEVSPPHARFALINTERLFMANDPSAEYQSLGGKSTLYWSDVLNPDYFNATVDYELVRPDDGDEVTFLKNVLGVLTIGKTRTISKFYTTASNTSSWTLSDPFSYIGCVAPYSAVDAQSGIIYLGRYGVFSFNGQSSSLISDVVTDKIRDILATNIEEVAGIYHDNRYLMSYTSEESGEANNNRVLILDVIRNSYYEDTKSIDSFAMFDSGDDFGTLYSGSSESDGNIYAHENPFSRLIYRYKSQLDGGTADSTYVGGTENNPWIILGDDEIWSESTDNWEDSGLKTWMISDLTGEWYSDTVYVGATQYDKIYWNEILRSSGDVTFAVRSGATTGDTLTASWSTEYSDPSGSDLSGLTANEYLQLRASLSSTLYTETPQVYLSDAFVIKLTYKQEGTTGESSILSVWESGETNLGGGENPKTIKEIHVYYEGTSGTLNFQYDNKQGDSYNFDIDLSVDPADSTTDNYFGTSTEKIYVHIPPFNAVPTGRRWTFTVSEDGTEQWEISRIVVRRQINSYTTFK